WVFVDEPVFRIEPIRVKFGNSKLKTANFSEAEQNKIKEYLHDLPLFQFDGEPELILARGNIFDSLKFSASGNLFKTVRHNLAADSLKDAFESYAQYKILKNLE